VQDFDLMPGATPDLPRSPYNRPDLVRDARDAEADAEPIDWRSAIRRRIVVLACLLLVWAVGIQVRLFVLQVVHHDRLKAALLEQLTHQVEVPGTRGAIVDRNGFALASSVDGDVIMVDALGIKAEDRATVASQLCALLERCSAEGRASVLAVLARKSRGAVVWRHASPSDAARVRALERSDVWVAREPRRYYPNRELAAHVVGFVGDGHQGLGGIERSYDEYLRGAPGTRLSYNDAKQQAYDSTETGAVAGKTLELTLDRRIQHIAEDVLARRIAETKSASGLAVVSDPRTGEILALASWPTFNPNAFTRVPKALLTNRAVQEVYEPGSTIKFVTVSAAIDLGVFTPESMFNLGNGQMRFGNHTVQDTHVYGALSLRDVVAKSSNIGAILVGQRLGARNLSDYVRRFGFGEANLRDFKGQSRGIVTPTDKVTPTTLASMSMGYSLGVTALQMIGAINVVANGGALVEPHVVRAIIDGPHRNVVASREIRRVISEQTAATVTSMLEAVVASGTGKAAQVPGFTVAGKTGTARKVKEGGRGYSDSYTSSFIGFAPSRSPVISILVVIDAPKAGGYYGGTIAAPVFQAIADQTLRYLGVPPTVESGQRPRVLVAQTESSGSSTALVAAPARRDRQPELTTVAITPGKMPDLRGLSARDAVRVATRLGLVVRVAGDGVVSEQDRAAGEPVEAGAVCRLTLERRAPVPVVRGTEP
jgi:cell division protein FtsI (penicillin-binding protein 3)